jgi:hypothetical protein
MTGTFVKVPCSRPNCSTGSMKEIRVSVQTHEQLEGGLISAKDEQRGEAGYNVFVQGEGS